MSFLVKKENGKLIFNNLGGIQTRNESTIWCIQEANKIYNWNDFNEIQIYTNDHDDEKNYSYSKINSYNKLVPDFNFYKWTQSGINDYIETINQISDNGKKQYIKNKVGWIGSILNQSRYKMLQIGINNNNLLDIIPMSWTNQNNNNMHTPSVYISLPELVETYKILIDIEGHGYSGRLKYLLWSHRPLIIVDRPYKEYFFEYLKEWEHYIPVKRDLSDLVEKTEWINNNYDIALLIADNAYNFSKKYLTREGCYEQWNKIINNIKHNL
jgi:hypothetical protein